MDAPTSAPRGRGGEQNQTKSTTCASERALQSASAQPLCTRQRTQRPSPPQHLWPARVPPFRLHSSLVLVPQIHSEGTQHCEPVKMAPGPEQSLLALAKHWLLLPSVQHIVPVHVFPGPLQPSMAPATQVMSSGTQHFVPVKDTEGPLQPPPVPGTHWAGPFTRQYVPVQKSPPHALQTPMVPAAGVQSSGTQHWVPVKSTLGPTQVTRRPSHTLLLLRAAQRARPLHARPLATFDRAGTAAPILRQTALRACPREFRLPALGLHAGHAKLLRLKAAIRSGPEIAALLARLLTTSGAHGARHATVLTRPAHAMAVATAGCTWHASGRRLCAALLTRPEEIRVCGAQVSMAAGACPTCR